MDTASYFERECFNFLKNLGDSVLQNLLRVQNLFWQVVYKLGNDLMKIVISFHQKIGVAKNLLDRVSYFSSY